jgi:hypothetical protein
MLANQGQINIPHPCIQEKKQEKPTLVDLIHPHKDKKPAKTKEPRKQKNGCSPLSNAN